MMEVKKEINALRRKLENMVSTSKYLWDADVVECSQRLDKLIDRYYMEVTTRLTNAEGTID
jgi:hypothetical protein